MVVQIKSTLNDVEKANDRLWNMIKRKLVEQTFENIETITSFPPEHLHVLQVRYMLPV